MTLARLLALALAVIALTAAGCGGDDDDGGGDGAATEQAPAETAPAETAPDTGAPTSEVTMTEFEFEPSDVVAEQGSTITVRNEGSIGHDLKLRQNGEVIGGTDVFQGGQTEELQVDFEPGTYEMFCSVPGHEDSGMKGTFTVK